METAQLMWCGGRVVVGGGKVSLRNGRTLAEDGGVEEEGAVVHTAAYGTNLATIREGGAVVLYTVEEAPGATPKLRDEFTMEGAAFASWHILGKKAVSGFTAALTEHEKMKPHKAGDVVLLVASSAREESSVAVYNLRTKLLSTIRTVEGAITQFAASSPDPHTVAVVQGAAAQVMLFGNGDVKTISNKNRICSVAVHPFSHTVSFGDSTGRIRTWLLPAMTMKEAHWHAHALSVLAWSPDGTTLASGGEEAVLCLWNGRSWASNKITRLPGHIIGTSWNPNSSKLVVGCAPSGVLLIDVAQRKPTTLVHGAELMLGQRCEAVVPAPTAGGVCAALVGLENVIRVYDPVNLKYLKTIKVAHKNVSSRIDSAALPTIKVTQAALTPGGEHLATFEDSDVILPSGKRENTLRFWNLSEPGTLDYSVNTFVSSPHEGDCVAVLFSPNRRVCVTVGSDCSVKRWGFRGDHWAHMATTTLTGDSASCASMSQDGTVVSVGVDWAVQCLSVGTFEPLAALTQTLSAAPLQSVHHIECGDEAKAEGSRYHLAATSATHVFMWDLSAAREGGEDVLEYAVEVPVDAAATYDGQAVVVSARGTFLLFSKASPVPVQTLKVADRPVRSLFAPQGRGMLLYVAYDGRFRHVEKSLSDAFLGMTPAAAAAAAAAPAAPAAPAGAKPTGAKALTELFGAASLPARPASLLPTGSLMAFQDPNSSCKTLSTFYDGDTHALQAPAPALGRLLDSLLTPL
eukprot:TRINITY_DN25050_c0_g1_i1.p1 TRINITY_DN25050_c0_g1~~TRINITY_DN25050_c0_g1_i1.p1  ORF type:complete len:744 (+),score=260.42 TRINITY_DN25050_c0_g1_i1:112-2343(+)